MKQSWRKEKERKIKERTAKQNKNFFQKLLNTFSKAFLIFQSCENSDFLLVIETTNEENTEKSVSLSLVASLFTTFQLEYPQPF